MAGLLGYTLRQGTTLLKPFPSDLMATHEVSKRVNNPKYDLPECVLAA
jgi:hypothetical protein